MSSWIKLYRDIWESAVIRKDNDYLAVWIYILTCASHKEHTTMIGDEKIVIASGQFVDTQVNMAEKTKVQRTKLARILKMLKNEQQIELKTFPKCSLFTVVNWNKYQTDEQQSEHEVNTKRTRNEHEVNTKQECKNDKNVNNNIYTCAFEEFWKFYPRKKDKGNACKKFDARLKAGFSEDELIQSAKNYADECRKSETDQKYIKHATTFLSDALPFVDYLDKNYKPPKKESMRPKNSREFKERDYDYDDLEKQLRVSQQKRIQNLIKGEQNE